MLILVLDSILVLSIDIHVEIYLRFLKFVAQQNDSLSSDDSGVEVC